MVAAYNNSLQIVQSHSLKYNPSIKLREKQKKEAQSSEKEEVSFIDEILQHFQEIPMTRRDVIQHLQSKYEISEPQLNLNRNHSYTVG